MMRWRTAVAAALLVGVAGVATVQTATAAEKQKITITSVGDGFQFFPVYIARGAGLFAEEGLDADWVNVGSGTKQAASVMGGSAEMTPLALMHAIKSQAQGADLVAFANLLNDWSMVVVLSNDAIKKTGIQLAMPVDEKIKRLNGLKIGITSPGSSTDVSIRTMLMARDMVPDQVVKLQPLGDGTAILAAFDKKLVDGFVFASPVPEIVEARGLGKIVINPLAREVPEQVGVPYSVMATSRATFEKKPEVIRASARAMTKALIFAHDKPAETLKIMQHYFPDVEPAILARIVTTYRAALPSSPVITREDVAKTVKFMNIGAAKPIDVKYDAVVLTGPAEAAAAALLKKK
jgi:NitT/TauT family transport system substrate-binding protein